MLTVHHGYVVDADGAPVPEATIVILKSSVPMPEIALLADENGRFVLRLPPGRFTLRAHGAGGAIGDVDFESEPDAEDIVIVVCRGYEDTTSTKRRS